MKTLLVYSSVTGNTQCVAKAIAKVFQKNITVAPVHRAPSPQGYDLLLLGFWVYRGKPDPRMLRYMARVRQQTVALFGTLAAWPDSLHAQKVLRHAHQALPHAQVISDFLCQGKLAPYRFETCMQPSYQNAKHPMTAERKARLIEAQSHPDIHDLTEAARHFNALRSNLLGNKNR